MMVGAAPFLASCGEPAPPPQPLAFEPVSRVFCGDAAAAPSEFTVDDIRHSRDGTVRVLTCTIEFGDLPEVAEMAERYRSLFTENEAAAPAYLDVLGTLLRAVMVKSGRHEQHGVFEGALIARMTLNVVALQLELITEEDAMRIALQLKELSVGDPRSRKRAAMIP